MAVKLISVTCPEWHGCQPDNLSQWLCHDGKSRASLRNHQIREKPPVDQTEGLKGRNVFIWVYIDVILTSCDLCSCAAGEFGMTTDHSRNSNKADSKKNSVDNHFKYPLYFCICDLPELFCCFYVWSITRGTAQICHRDKSETLLEMSPGWRPLHFYFRLNFL